MCIYFYFCFNIFIFQKTAIASIVVKEVLFQMTMFIGKKQNSQLLMANAWHHRGDAISSVVALIGIAGAQLGYPALDPIAGLAVAGLIIKIGFSTSWESLKVILCYVFVVNLF
jgi:divalent metal cation (Fe/Co/Zn/Cd) transporter